jgi:MFS transporter, ACS family, hexuronate transporter
MGEPSDRMKKNKWLFFFLCWLGMAIFFGERWIFGPLIPYLMSDFHIDRVTAGAIVSAHMLGYVLMPIVAGIFSDRFGRRPAVLSGLFGLSFFTLLSGFTASHQQMMVTRFLSGMTEPFFAVALMAHFMELFPTSPAFFVTSMISGTSIGWFAGPILSGRLLQASANWRHPFWIMGVAGLLLFCILLFCWYDQKVFKGAVPVTGDESARPGRTALAAVLVILSVVVFFDCIAEFGFSIWLPSFLTQERAFSIADAGVIASMWGIGQFFGRPLLGLLSDRTGYRHVAVPAACLLGVSFHLFLSSESRVSLMFWQFTAGFVGGAVMGSLWTFTAIVYGKRKGMALGLISNLGSVGSVVGPVLGGYLADRYSLKTSLTMMGVFPAFVCGALFLISFLWIKGNVRTGFHHCS